MSRARKRFDDKLHHSFDKNIHKLSEKYPLYSEELSSWLSMPTANIRQNMSALQSKLKSIMPLAEELSNIKLGVKGSDAKLVKLTKNIQIGVLLLVIYAVMIGKKDVTTFISYSNKALLC